MSTLAAVVAILALTGTILNAAVASYYNRQARNHVLGFAEDPKPWYVRAFDRLPTRNDKDRRAT